MLPPPDSEPFAQITVDAPPSQIWAILTDVESYPRIISAVDSVIVNDGDAGKEGDNAAPEFKAGLAWNETRTMMGRSETERMVLEEVDADNFAYRISSESCGARMEFVHRIVPAPSSVEVPVESRGEGTASSGEKEKGSAESVLQLYFSSKALTWVAWSFGWLAYLTRGMMRSAILQDLRDIKAAVEGGGDGNEKKEDVNAGG